MCTSPARARSVRRSLLLPPSPPSSSILYSFPPARLLLALSHSHCICMLESIPDVRQCWLGANQLGAGTASYSFKERHTDGSSQCGVKQSLSLRMAGCSCSRAFAVSRWLTLLLLEFLRVRIPRHQDVSIIDEVWCRHIDQEPDDLEARWTE